MALHADNQIFFPTFPSMSHRIQSLTDKALHMLQERGQGSQQRDSFTCFCNKFCCCRGEEGAVSSGSRQDEMSHREEMSHGPSRAKGVPQRRGTRNQSLLPSWGTLKKRIHKLGQHAPLDRRTHHYHATDVRSHFEQLKGLRRSKSLNSSDSVFLPHLSAFLTMVGRPLRLTNVIRVSEKKS